jgi:hypothetical protein
MLSLTSGRRAQHALLRPLENEFESPVKGCQEKTVIWAIELMLSRSDQQDVAVVHVVGEG